METPYLFTVFEHIIARDVVRKLAQVSFQFLDFYGQKKQLNIEFSKIWPEEFWSEKKLKWPNIEGDASNLQLTKVHFPTLSSHFFTNYMNIFPKTEVQTIILKCWTGLYLNWFKTQIFPFQFFQLITCYLCYVFSIFCIFCVVLHVFHNFWAN